MFVACVVCEILSDSLYNKMDIANMAVWFEMNESIGMHVVVIYLDMMMIMMMIVMMTTTTTTTMMMMMMMMI